MDALLQQVRALGALPNDPASTITVAFKARRIRLVDSQGLR